jgi:Flp pilus assembly protein TadG
MSDSATTTTRAIRRGSHRGRRRGAALVEAGLVLPVVCLFLFGVLEYGRYVMMLQVLTNAAREGARYSMIHTQPVTVGGTTYGNSTNDVLNVVNKALAGHKLSGQSVQVYAADSLGNNIGTWTNAQAGESVCVRISGNYVPIVPNLLYMPVSIPVVARSVMRSESN